MLLSELLEQLGFGELSQHKLSSSGVILPADYPATINHINKALTALHARFPLINKELNLLQFEGITDYQLDIKYSVSADDPTVGDKYIFDTIEKPFLNDLIRVDAAYDSEGYPVTLNDEGKITSWFTPTNDTIQIPNPTEGAMATIMYRAKHATIEPNPTSPEMISVNIPVCLEAALGAHIASRAFIALGNQTSIQLSAYFAQLYQTEIKQVIDLNLLQSSSNSSNMKFYKGGWV